MRLVLSNSTMLRRMNDFAKLHDNKLLLYKGKSVVQANQSTPNPGKTFVIDNLDLRQKVSNMTEENQNVDYHWVNANLINNRVSANHLHDNGPIKDVMEVQVSDVLPSPEDHLAYAKNIKTHIQRILVKRVPCLQFMQECVVHHIPHPHQKEMSKKANKVGFLQCTIYLFYQLSCNFNYVLHVCDARQIFSSMDNH